MHWVHFLNDYLFLAGPEGSGRKTFKIETQLVTQDEKFKIHPFISIHTSYIANKSHQYWKKHIYLMYITMSQGSHNRQEEDDDNDLYKEKPSYPFVDGVGQV